jgi:uncharacterized membrane protein YfcA
VETEGPGVGTLRAVTYVLVALVVGVAAAAQATSGFGFSLVAVPLLAVLIGSKTGVVTNNLVGTGLVALMVLRNRHGVDRRTVLLASIGAVIAMPLGLLVLTHVSDRALAGVIGVTVLVLTAALFKGLRFPDRTITDLVAGLCSGALVTSTGTNGPPLVIALHGKDLEPSAFRATLAATFIVQDVASLGAFWLAGRLTADAGRAAIAGYPAMVVGLLLGERLAARMDRTRFRAIVLAMLVASAVASIASAIL